MWEGNVFSICLSTGRRGTGPVGGPVQWGVPSPRVGGYPSPRWGGGVTIVPGRGGYPYICPPPPHTHKHSFCKKMGFLGLFFAPEVNPEAGAWAVRLLRSRRRTFLFDIYFQSKTRILHGVNFSIICLYSSVYPFLVCQQYR